MKALVYTGTMQSEIRDVEPTAAEAGQVVVNVHQCGVCGSDMHAWHGLDERRIPPLILGHEAVGTATSGQFAGQRVVINPLMSCGECSSCLSGQEHLCGSRELLGMRIPGAFAEQVVIREQNLTPISDNLKDADAALAEPLACAVNAVQLAVNHISDPDAIVHVLGGGAIGLLCAKVLLHKGFKHIFIAETNPLRRKMLEQLDDVLAYDPTQDIPHAEKIDIIVDAVGSGKTRALSSAAVRPGGVISHIGLQDSEAGLDTRRITLQQILFTGSYCYSRLEFAEAVNLLEIGRITSDGWSEIRELDDGASAFIDIHDGKAPPKIILNIAS